MFGYVCIDKPELKIKDYEAYKAVYCGLCKQLVREYSPLSAILLNYDLTFFALFSVAVSEQPPCFHKGRCKFNPLKKCSYIKSAKVPLAKASALLMLISYYKLLDNMRDGGFFEKIGCTLLRPLFSFWKKKASKKFPDYYILCEDMYLGQIEAEKNTAGIDEASEPTAKLLAKVFSYEADSEHIKPAFYEFGYHLGKWIYLMDAVDDLAEDEKKDNFNPLRNIKEKNVKEYCDGVLSQSVFRLTSAYELIDKNSFKAVLDNIVLVGLTKKQKNILYSGKEIKNG
ncbi:MAG: DUF5685 family protein [Ruminococcus sp.]